MQRAMSPYLQVFVSRTMAVMLLLGFSSGLPLALTAGTLQAWMTVEGVDLKTIGLFALIGLPYTLKFLWSPLMDRFVPPLFGRRRGWIVLTQGALLIAIAAMSAPSPAESPMMMAVLALIVAFFSASQDIVVDAYRTDVLKEEERGAGVAVFVSGYRIGMLVSGAIAMVLSAGIGWHAVYLLMGCLMAIGMGATLLAHEPHNGIKPPKTLAAAVAEPLKDFFTRPRALLLLLLIVLYKLADAYAGTMTTAFLIRGAGFTAAEVGLVNKGFGLAALVGGAFLGGAIMSRMGLYRALMTFGILQAVSILTFVPLAYMGKNWPVMITAIGLENLCGGMGTAAFVALLMSLCNVNFSATQYALLSSLASLGRVAITPTSGYLVEMMGWGQFFVFAALTGAPGLFLLQHLRVNITEIGHRKAAES